MRVAVVQYAPQLGAPRENAERVRALLREYVGR